MFDIVEVETINFCNNDCAFCPVNIHYDNREHRIMSSEMIDGILCELKEIQYEGQVNLFSQNEPFLDSRIIHIAAAFRKTLPAARIVLYSNCLEMSFEKFAGIIQNLDHMVFNLYYPLPLEVERIVTKCMEYADKMTLSDRLEIRRRRKDDVLTTKAGLAPNKKYFMDQPESCILPFRQIVVRATGNVVLCCNDTFEQHVMGNIKENTLMEIWTSDIYKHYRNEIQKGRQYIDLCASCDVDCRKQKGLAWLMES